MSNEVEFFYNTSNPRLLPLTHQPTFTLESPLILTNPDSLKISNLNRDIYSELPSWKTEFICNAARWAELALYSLLKWLIDNLRKFKVLCYHESKKRETTRTNLSIVYMHIQELLPPSLMEHTSIFTLPSTITPKLPNWIATNLSFVKNKEYIHW